MKNMNLRGSYLLSKNEVLIDYVKTRLRLLFITSWGEILPESRGFGNIPCRIHNNQHNTLFQMDNVQ